MQDFLRELAGCSQLQQLTGVHPRDDSSSSQLCASLAAWPKLQRLGVRVDAYRVSWHDDISSVAAACCPVLARVSLQDSQLSSAGVAALASMKQLRHLCLSSVSLPITFFHDLAGSLLQQLEIAMCRGMKCAAKEHLAVFLAEHSLTKLTLLIPSYSSACLVACAAAIATSRSTLRSVVIMGFLNPTGRQRYAMRRPLPGAEADAAVTPDEDAVSKALADAFCSSAVTDWKLAVPIPVLSFLRQWDSRTPAAAVEELSGLRWQDEAVRDAEDFVPLLLRCLRSCPSLREVRLPFSYIRKEQLVQLQAAVTEDASLPSLRTEAGDRLHDMDISKYMRSAGVAP
eukprot:PLAT955.1.p1 GENE.PLAT955.1~~PLAT955.1.p1  ORF type:complete len:350 (+),score=81.12 PLAT955.1:25-1050(+)